MVVVIATQPRNSSHVLTAPPVLGKPGTVPQHMTLSPPTITPAGPCGSELGAGIGGDGAETGAGIYALFPYIYFAVGQEIRVRTWYH
ncbi:hypothetical protein HDU96_005252, partial [Phlyctochytrium bullatum]